MCVPSFIAIAPLDQILERGDDSSTPPACVKSKSPGLDRVKVPSTHPNFQGFLSVRLVPGSVCKLHKNYVLREDKNGTTVAVTRQYFFNFLVIWCVKNG